MNPEAPNLGNQADLARRLYSPSNTTPQGAYLGPQFNPTGGAITSILLDRLENVCQYGIAWPPSKRLTITQRFIRSTLLSESPQQSRNPKPFENPFKPITAQHRSKCNGKYSKRKSKRF